MGSVEQTMKNFLYSLFIGLFGIAALTSIAFLLMYAAQSKQQAHLYSDLAAVRKQDNRKRLRNQRNRHHTKTYIGKTQIWSAGFLSRTPTLTIP